MCPTALDHEEMKQRVMQQLQKSFIGVLATAEGDRVTARQMLLISDGLKIYCMTSTLTRKYGQISVNPNVAIAMGNMQIDGVACFRGRTSDAQNAGFLKAWEKLSPQTYEHYRAECEDPNTNCHVIEITPKRIALFYGPPIPDRHLDVLNIDEQTAFRTDRSEYFGRLPAR